MFVYLIIVVIPHTYNKNSNDIYEAALNEIQSKYTNVEVIQENVTKILGEKGILIQYYQNGIYTVCGFKRSCIEYTESKYDPDVIEASDNFELRTLSLTLDNGEILIIDIIGVSFPAFQIKKTILHALPWIIIAGLISSLILSYISMRSLTKTVLDVNNNVKKIRMLDFKIFSKIKSNDELEELSNNVVLVAKSLEDNINQLTDSNTKLHQALEKKASSEKEKRSYIASISHDLKTPLTMIKGYTEGMYYNLGRYKDHNFYLARNLAEIEEIEAMINNLISCVAIDELPIELEITKDRIDDLIKRVISKYEYYTEKNGIVIKILGDETLEYLVDKTFFYRVIENLISNAFRYSDHNHDVIVNLEPNMISISNHCHDFDPSSIEQNKIFKAFYRQDESRNKMGSGLGLFFVKEIADLHDVKINISFNNDIVTFSLLFKDN